MKKKNPTPPERTPAAGYKKPPKKYQFAPGQSGNPKGRPKGTRSFKSDLLAELSEPIEFRDGDRRVTISKQRAIIKRLVKSATDGDARSLTALLALIGRMMSDTNDDPFEAPEDEEILRRFGALAVTEQ